MVTRSHPLGLHHRRHLCLAAPSTSPAAPLPRPPPPLAQAGKLCATPYGIDVVGITELVLATGALVGGITARQRGQEMERLNEQLRKINMSLRQQARAGTVYAPGVGGGVSYVRAVYAPGVEGAGESYVGAVHAPGEEGGGGGLTLGLSTHPVSRGQGGLTLGLSTHPVRGGVLRWDDSLGMVVGMHWGIFKEGVSDHDASRPWPWNADQHAAMSPAAQGRERLHGCHPGTGMCHCEVLLLASQQEATNATPGLKVDVNTRFATTWRQQSSGSVNRQPHLK